MFVFPHSFATHLAALPAHAAQAASPHVPPILHNAAVAAGSVGEMALAILLVILKTPDW